MQSADRDTRTAAWFWSVQELPAILERWGAGLPADRIHVITVPPAGAKRTELWSRFVTGFGLENIPLVATAERANPSLGAHEPHYLAEITPRQVHPPARTWA